jgi:DNA-binding HxlR family transcriptional regulator
VRNRTYEQYCPIAVALDVLGDRWTLLIMRELLIGDQRFTDLRRALPGMAPNLLSERLRRLEDEGLVTRLELPPPVARMVYSATDAGVEVVPVLRALARFGVDRMSRPDDEVVIRPGMAVYGLLTPFHRPNPDAPRMHTRVIVDGTAFDVLTDGERVSTRPRPAAEPDLLITTTTAAMVRARQEGAPLTDEAEVVGSADSRREFEERFGLRV